LERTALLTVRKDPNTTGTEDDVAAETAMMVQIRGKMNAAARLFNDAASIRSQIAALEGGRRRGPAYEGTSGGRRRTRSRIVAVEAGLFNMTATGRGQDQLRTLSQMVEKLSLLGSIVPPPSK
jgi:hypothetical protein